MKLVVGKKPIIGRKPVVYLAGGMRSNWQNTVKEVCGNLFTYIDPRNNGTSKEEEYALLDACGIEGGADIVFGYMEKTNPCNGMNIGWEMGFGKGCGCLVLFVNEKYTEDSEDPKQHRYVSLCRQMADRYAESFETGVEMLRLLGELYKSMNPPALYTDSSIVIGVRE